MPTIVVSDHAYVAINTKALVPFENAGEQRPNGDWEVFISDSYVERMKPRMLPHESIGEAIERWYPVKGRPATRTKGTPS
jgi:hypothetical protein